MDDLDYIDRFDFNHDERQALLLWVQNDFLYLFLYSSAHSTASTSHSQTIKHWRLSFPAFAAKRNLNKCLISFSDP